MLGSVAEDALGLPVLFGKQNGRAGGRDLVQVDVEDLFGKLGDERVTAVEVLAFPAPAEGREHVKSHPDVLERDLVWDAFAPGHVAVEDDHSSDVQGDRGDEEGDVWEADEVVVYHDDVVRGDDRCRHRSEQSTLRFAEAGLTIDERTVPLSVLEFL